MVKKRWGITYLLSEHKEQCKSLQNSCVINKSEALVNLLVRVWLDVLKSFRLAEHFE